MRCNYLTLESMVKRKICYGIVQPGQSVTDGIPVIKVNNLISGLKSLSELDTTTRENEAKYIRTRLHGGELIISVVGTIGKTAIVPKSFAGCNLVRATALIDIEDALLSKWVKYYIDSPYGQSYIEQNLNTTVQPTLNIKSLEKMSIPLYDTEYMEKIVLLLSSLDEKIAINRAINDNLQQQAHAIYREWFIDYAPFGGEAPSDWKRGKLKDILSLQKRGTKAGAEPTLPYLPIDTIPMRTFAVSDFRPNEEAQSSLIQFRQDDILIGAMRVYFHRVIIAPCDGITRTTCFVLTPTDPAYLSFGLLTCDLDSSIDHAQNTSKGSTMPYAVWDGGMGEIEIAIPPLAVASEFNELVLPMLRQIQKSYYEVKALREIRDSMLPRLMSGDLDVSECF